MVYNKGSLNKEIFMYNLVSYKVWLHFDNKDSVKIYGCEKTTKTIELAMFEKSDYKFLGGKSQRYQNVKTGETISRRAFDKSSGKLSYEDLAKINWDIAPDRQILRPAKGRKSGQKLDAIAAQNEAKKRLENKTREAARQKALKEQRELARKIEAKKRKKVITQKITKSSLTPGKISKSIKFLYYQQYLDLWAQGKKLGIDVIFAYQIGVEGISNDTGEIQMFDAMNARDFDKPLTEDSFISKVEFRIEKASQSAGFIFTNYYMRFLFARKFYESLAEKNQSKIVARKNKANSKRKKK